DRAAQRRPHAPAGHVRAGPAPAPAAEELPARPRRGAGAPQREGVRAGRDRGADDPFAAGHARHRQRHRGPGDGRVDGRRGGRARRRADGVRGAQGPARRRQGVGRGAGGSQTRRIGREARGRARPAGGALGPAQAGRGGGTPEDPQLESLILEALAKNNTLTIAVQQVEIARALVRESRAGLLPQATLAPAVAWSRISNNGPALPGTQGKLLDAYALPVTLSYEF